MNRAAISSQQHGNAVNRQQITTRFTCTPPLSTHSPTHNRSLFILRFNHTGIIGNFHRGSTGDGPSAPGSEAARSRRPEEPRAPVLTGRPGLLASVTSGVLARGEKGRAGLHLPAKVQETKETSNCHLISDPVGMADVRFFYGSRGGPGRRGGGGFVGDN